MFDTHWISNFGCHMNANARPGDPELGDAIAADASRSGLQVLAHKVETLPLEYGTTVPMHYMNEGGWARVLSVAAPIFAILEENRMFGAACATAIEASSRKVAVKVQRRGPDGRHTHDVWHARLGCIQGRDPTAVSLFSIVQRSDHRRTSSVKASATLALRLSVRFARSDAKGSGLTTANRPESDQSRFSQAAIA